MFTLKELISKHDKKTKLRVRKSFWGPLAYVELIEVDGKTALLRFETGTTFKDSIDEPVWHEVILPHTL
jgi:hypothetical protein